jgi:hypothetical protein
VCIKQEMRCPLSLTFPSPPGPSTARRLGGSAAPFWPKSRCQEPPRLKQLGARLCLRVPGDLGESLDSPCYEGQGKGQLSLTEARAAEGAAVINYLQSMYLRTVGQHKITDTQFSYLDRIEGLISQAQCRNVQYAWKRSAAY